MDSPPDPRTAEHVRVDTPTDPRYLQLIRLATAGAGSEAGLTIDEIDDLKVAVDELCSSTIQAGELLGEGARIGLVYRFEDDGLVVEGSREGPGLAAHRLDDLVETILDATVDSYAFEASGDGLAFVVRKRRS